MPSPPPIMDSRPRASCWLARHRRGASMLVCPLVVAAYLLVVREAVTLLDAVRAYVGGESLWAKGQKGAVQSLYRFAITHDEADYIRYERALAVPRADRRARLELQGAHPDIAVAAHWFVEGKNHPNDAPHMARLFLMFGRVTYVSYIHDAIDIWTRGDAELDALDREARALHALVQSGRVTPGRLRAHVARIATTDDRLTVLEAAFSNTMGLGARWLAGVIFIVTALAGLLLAMTVVLVLNRLWRQERAAAELKRRRGEEFRALVEHAPDVIARFDRSLRHTYVNSAVTCATGLDPAEFIGRTHREIGFLPELADRWEGALRDVFWTGDDAQLEFAVQGPVGMRIYHARIAAERARDGSIESALAIGRDVSELKASEQALRESEARLRQAQKMEAVGRLAGGIAHDFNNLLTVIGVNLDLALLDLPADSPASPSLLVGALQASERAALLTQQLLTFSRNQVVQPRVLRLDATVTEMHDLVTRLIGEDVAIRAELDATTPAVEADPGQIGQVILNLAINARDAMPHGGTLTVRVRPTLGVVTDAITGDDTPRPAPWAVLEVTDTGVGMDAATRARIFEPFFTTKPDAHGTGLGLAVVYGIVSQSGGRIDVESTPGVGTTFRISLPPAASAAPASTPPTEPVVPLSTSDADDEVPRGGTILIVEDEDEVRALARLVLRRQGYDVLTATNGADALCLIETLDRHRSPVDLIISDVVMPKVTGRELVQELARRGWRTPVVFTSGYTNDAAPLEDMLGRSAVFLRKPFTARELGTVVRSVLQENGARVEPVCAA